ncbi:MULTISPECIES: SAM-dependent methyltransferase [Gemella]|uniref:SAM-dependent methyltransferase n=1 Tax=Gemella TaxID=1378 RepID=UPI0007680CB9|nr:MULTISPECIES: SAM-dependent methyltransferase [Gemella]AME08866.1 tetrapyrrole methylase [Gemella sp. oral taxon 928]AXI26437.1 tetrapyrrole methylase [Gemella sp. ND 6198]
MIYIVGLGPNDSYNIKENIKTLILENKNAKIIARIDEHPAMNFLRDNNILFETCDRFYLENDNFEDTYKQIAKYIVDVAKSNDVLYLLPGHPMVAELTTQLLIESDVEVNVVGGESFLDVCFNAFRFDPVESFTLLDATNLKSFSNINPYHHIIITQCYDDLTAANISTELMNYYPYDYEVKIVEQAGSKNERLYTSALNELSATVGEKINNLRAVYIPPFKKGQSFNIKDYTLEFDENANITEVQLIEKLENIIKKLRENSKSSDLSQKNTELLAKLINTALDFTIAGDSYYEFSDILDEMKKDRKNG